MGRKSITGGVEPKGDRIQLTFFYQGKRYRPTIDLPPTQTNLRHARRQVGEINRKITLGTFDFAAEFPEYRFIEAVAPRSPLATFDDIADKFLAASADLEWATRESYRKILRSFWRPKIGTRPFVEIKYAELAAIVGGHPWGSNKTRNNIVSAGRRVFDLGYADIHDRPNPAEKLKSLRVQRPRPDPYTIEEAEAIIAGMREDWGEHDANYVEFGFFTGARPSEIIALDWPRMTGNESARIERARVMGKDKDTTKTAESRDLELCPRAVDVIRRQRALTSLAGGAVFTRDNGEPFNDLQLQWRRWRFTHKRLKIRYREPYQMRHSSVTWNLMIGKPLLWVAEQHGHSAAVMLKVYAKWMKGTSEKDLDAIRRAMGFATITPLARRRNMRISK